jgi:hypothetical protein
MRKLRRRPIPTFNDIFALAAEHIRVYSLPADDLYSFGVIAQVNGDWYRFDLDRVEYVNERWIQSRKWITKQVPVNWNMEIDCMALLNEFGEVVVFRDVAIVAEEGEHLDLTYEIGIGRNNFQISKWKSAY